MRGIFFGLLYSMCLFSTGANAQSTIDFDHGVGGNISRTVKVSDGHVLTVNVLNTCPKLFNYEYIGYDGPRLPATLRADADSLGDSQQRCAKLEDTDLRTYVDQNMELGGVCVPESKSVRIPHEAKYGGYLIEITKVDPKQTIRRLLNKDKLLAEFAERARSLTGSDAQPCAAVMQQAWEKTLISSEALKPLADSSILISVQLTGWTYGIAGAFTASEVTNREFAIISNDETPASDSRIVVRDKNGEDTIALGAAAMIHLYNPDQSGWISDWAISFGLGIGESNKVSYFVGPSYRFGQQAFITLGMNVGAVDTLPSGQREGAAPESDNVLNNLGSTTEAGMFLSISYSFLAPGEGAFRGAFATKTTVAGESQSAK